MQRTSLRSNCAGGGDIERENNGEAYRGCDIKMPYGNKGAGGS